VSTKVRRTVGGRVVALAAVLVLAVVLSAGNARAQQRDTPAVDATATVKAAADLSQGILLAPKAFTAAANKVLPSLVTIESFGGVSAGQGRIGGIRRPGDGPTTGVIVSSDGYILTSTFNFIKQPPVITVVFRDGQRRVAKLLGRDETRHLCLLKVDGVEDLPIPQAVPRSELKVGQWAVSVGIGFGDTDPALSAGIISATSRAMGRAVQTDANISPANYGGPLVDIEGRVIGICVPLNPASTEAGAGVEWYDSGIGFAIPLEGLDPVIAAMREGKIVKAGYLGVQMKPASEDGQGVVVEAVQDGFPAKEAGIQPGDVITSVDGEPVQDMLQLRIAVGRHAEGETVKLTIRRGEETMELEIKLAAAPEQPQVQPQMPPDENPPPDEKPSGEKPSRDPFGEPEDEGAGDKPSGDEAPEQP